jgi:hypothetical protein
VKVDRDGTPLVSLGEGAQLGDLPETVRERLGC